jgi:putative endonuclease
VPQLRRQFRTTSGSSGGSSEKMPRTDRARLQRRLTMVETVYSVYIVRCADGSYYTGIATDVARRIAEHEESPKGAKYLKGRGPLMLEYSEIVGDRSSASKLEYRIKQLSRMDKQALIEGRMALSDLRINQDSAAG